MPKKLNEQPEGASPSESVDAYKDHELCSVVGIGPTTAKKLVEEGFDSVQSVAVARPDTLKEILGWTGGKVKATIQDAKSKTMDRMPLAETLKQRLDHKKNVTKRISTGSLAIDNLLRGGVPTETTVCASGAYSSGKTQLGDQLVVNTVKQGRKAIWIETETSTFVPERIIEIAKANNVNIDLEKDIFVFPSVPDQTPFNLFFTYERAKKLIDDLKLDIGIVVIDSFTAPFQTFFIGRDQLPAKHQEEARHLGFLDGLASKYNLLVFMTNQIMATPDQGGQLKNLTKTGTKDDICGGNALKHSATYHFTLNKWKSDEYEFIVSDAPDIPFTKVNFRILSSGIKDVSARG